ncbi:MAG: hypothetical protein HDR71_13950 [Lachnospiraceae bacterium]|nr:hypothetical protein [Lachnospiraceae bacterium]
MIDLYDTLEIIALAAACIFLYYRFGRRPQIKAVKPVKIPTTQEIKKQRKKERLRRKFRRRFRIPYRGNAEIIEYSKTTPYIESAWNEVEKEQHGKRHGSRKGRGI